VCYDSKAQPPIPVGEPTATRDEDLVLTAADGTQFAAYRAAPQTTPTAGIVILPDVRGLHQFYKDLAVRFAEQGVAAVALDYFGRSAGLTARNDDFEYRPHVMQLTFDAIQEDVAAALASLTEAAPGVPTFTVGFCMGGSLSYLMGTRDLPLTGVIGFYAGLSRDFAGAGTLMDRASDVHLPSLGLFGGADAHISADQVEAFDKALDSTGVPHEIVSYEGAPHSFFDHQAAEYATASADAWTRMLGFIASHAPAAA